MPYRVELVDDAFSDLERLNKTGRIVDFLTKLVRIEEAGTKAGMPLGHKERLRQNLTGWWKVVVGDRDWRIVFKEDEQTQVATILVIGERSDAECYAEAMRRLNTMTEHRSARSLSEAMLRLLAHKASKRR
jgi:mRNA interferase RelE/StbE